MTTQLHVQVPEGVLRAFELQAERRSCEVQDIAVWTMAMAAADFPDLSSEHQLQIGAELSAVTAETQLKVRVKRKVKRMISEAIPPDLVLRVFREVRKNEKLLDLYRQAIGAEKGGEQGSSSEKSRLNRTLGAWIKKCAGAEHRRDAEGTRVKEYVKGELIRTYTPLVPIGHHEEAVD